MAGYTVKFVQRNEQKRAHLAGVLINGELWELKTPTSGKASAVDKSVRKALFIPSEVCGVRLASDECCV